VKNLDKERITKEIILAMGASIKLQEQLCNDLTQAKSTLEETGEKLKAKEQLINELMYAGFFFTTEDFADICLGSPYGEWCPVPLNTPVRFRSFTTRKYIDFDFTGGHSLHMYQGLDHTNQKVYILCTTFLSLANPPWLPVDYHSCWTQRISYSSMSIGFRSLSHHWECW